MGLGSEIRDAPMIYTAQYVMFLMRADTLCGEVGGCWRWSFLGLKLHSPSSSCNFTGARIKNITHGALLTIYAPMIYTAPCVMFLMRADTLCVCPHQ